MKLSATAALILSALAATCGASGGSYASWFPFEKGRYWLYDGTVKFAQDGQVTEKPIFGWRCEVTETFACAEFRAALLKGYPSDLAWFEEGKQRGDAIIILTAQGEFHEIPAGKNPAELFASIRSSGKLPENVIGHDTILFRIPPKAGDRAGDPEATKLGARYCWVLLDAGRRTLDSPIRGVSAGEEFEMVTLTYRTSPDHTNVVFARGLGITFYEYVHHGTKGDCEVRLRETGRN